MKMLRDCPHFCPRFGLHGATPHAQLLPKMTRPRARNSLGRLRFLLQRRHFVNVARTDCKTVIPRFESGCRLLPGGHARDVPRAARREGM